MSHFSNINKIQSPTKTQNIKENTENIHMCLTKTKFRRNAEHRYVNILNISMLTESKSNRGKNEPKETSHCSFIILRTLNMYLKHHLSPTNVINYTLFLILSSYQIPN